MRTKMMFLAISMMLSACLDSEAPYDDISSQESAIEDPGQAPAPGDNDMQVDWPNYCQRGYDACMKGPGDWLIFCTLGTGGVATRSCWDDFQRANVSCSIDLSNCHLGGMGTIPLREDEPDSQL